ncbi:MULTISPECIES: NRDE family protein [Nonomuraea]|uniref:NRDE family protein n=1 Tax=Nonomuraea ferruginea TaxID=46174 RepID=A0ABT4T4D8_9ACTN|nr:NRDE family protein [Nonomuraea ferruginea]MDA0644387.1 NRDE family protein [Nonomuraea ferruginea]
MCTVIVRTGRPLTLMGIRDEFADRPWEGPAEHWPDHPGVVGGRDLKAGGTWLAVDRQARRAAALLNGRGLPAPEIRKLSRGDLPLLAVSSGEMPDVDLTRYDPFHLVLAGLSGARVFSWDGHRLEAAELPDGTSVIVNTGLDPGHERVTTNLPRFAGDADWHEPLRDPPSDAPDALIVRHELPDGRVFASLSVTLLTLAPDGVTYEFTDMTADQHG